MKNFSPSQRVYKNINTGEYFRMYVDDLNHSMILINEKTDQKIKNFVCAAFDGVHYKFADGTTTYLSSGEFWEIQSDNLPTHNKYFASQRWRKIK